jgi:transposase InsO family protein
MFLLFYLDFSSLITPCGADRWMVPAVSTVSAGTGTGTRQVPTVTNVRDLFTRVALVLFITDVISDNECRKEREPVFWEGKWGQQGSPACCSLR